MKQIYLKSFCARCLTLLILALLSTNLAWGEKITTLAGITSGNKYYIGATTSSKDYYFSVDGSSTSTSIAGTAVDKKSNATVLKFTAVTDGWTIQFDNGNYLGLKNDKDNGKVQVCAEAVVWTIEEITDKALLKLHPNDSYSLQKNNSGTQFGSYGNTQTNVWLEAAGSSKTLSSIAISGTPTKTAYQTGESFDVTGLTITGTYDDASTANLTDDAEWTIAPATFTSTSQTSVSVTATVSEIESDPFEVTGLTVTQFVQTYANTYTSNVTLSKVGGTSASEAEVRIKNINYGAIKAGSSSIKGKCVVTIPANTKTLHFHAAGWNGEEVTLDVNDTKYTLVADEKISGNGPTFTLQNDPETQDYFTFDPKGATTITFSASKTTTGKRFVLFGVNAEPFKAQDVTITDAGWATVCLPFNATITSGNAIAYYVIGTEGNVLTKVEADVIPAGEGVLLKSNDGGAATVTFTETAVAADEVEANYMKGAITETTFNESGYKYYILANGDKGLGFYYQGTENDGSSVTCAAGKAVLAVPETAGAKAFFSLDDEPTGITSYENDNDNENLKAMTVYNLNGMKVNNSYKGIVIMNGKKYINK